MNMDTKFYGLGSDLKEILYNEFNKNEDVFYIFENPTSYYEIKKEYLKISENIFHNFKLLKERGGKNEMQLNIKLTKEKRNCKNK